MNTANPALPKPSQAQHHKARSCDGKQRLGRKHAHRAARVLTQAGDPCHAYPCQHCHRWHVGGTWEDS